MQIHICSCVGEQHYFCHFFCLLVGCEQPPVKPRNILNIYLIYIFIFINKKPSTVPRVFLLFYAIYQRDFYHFSGHQKLKAEMSELQDVTGFPKIIMIGFNEFRLLESSLNHNISVIHMQVLKKAKIKKN